jgi:hypothetical protein
MEAALKDFEEWMASLPVAEIQYYAIFDDSGAVTGIYPDHAAIEIKNKIPVDRDIVESVIEGKTSVHSYRVDLTSASVEFIEVQTLRKIDDVLHRVVNYDWCRVQFNDIFLTYNRKEQRLIFELSSRYNGTKIVSNEGAPFKNIHWVNDTEMLFLFTHFNDPHYLDCSIVIKIQELIKNKKVIDNIDLPKNFSVYTRRLFKNYVVEEI